VRSSRDAAAIAQFLVAALEGAILLTKVTRDIVVMERCVEELKQHLALYTVEPNDKPSGPAEPARRRTT
jgi:hypothetical protein